ncbi:hypothetical protein BMETH_92_2 [methanotrophic bacterial endosymbiont of Bathymodiolus sp.]|nr:hypothetical protein BMETH_92_2 [methanotrophic bacterial endosymbiont of Bathymodiolus sp.]
MLLKLYLYTGKKSTKELRTNKQVVHPLKVQVLLPSLEAVV